MDDRTPVLVGVGQLTVRPGEPSMGPVEMMAETVRGAVADSGSDRLLGAVQSVRVVALLSRRYGDPGEMVAQELGLGDVETVVTTDGGNSVGMLLGNTARSILDGELDVAVLTGGEAWRTRQRARRDGVELDWADQPSDAAANLVMGAPLDMTHPVETALGVVHPVEVYPMFEHAVRAHAGRSVAEHTTMLGALWARFSEVAAGNPDAWDRTVHTAAEIVTPSPTNRMVAHPYTKLLCSNEMVDQSAAVIMCSAGAARALGVPADRWVFPVAAAEAKAPKVSERHDLWSSPMVGACGRQLRSMSGLGPDDIAYLDVYSCFPSAVEIQAVELGFGLDRQLTLTGGMRFFGGPWNNYPMHGLVAMVAKLRDDDGTFGLCTFNGGYISKQVTAVLSSSPPAEAFRFASAQAEADTHPGRVVDPDPNGTGVVESYTVAHNREGPTRGIVVALMPDARRGWGIVTDPAAMRALEAEDPIGRRVELVGGGATVL